MRCACFIRPSLVPPISPHLGNATGPKQSRSLGSVSVTQAGLWGPWTKLGLTLLKEAPGNQVLKGGGILKAYEERMDKLGSGLLEAALEPLGG